MNIKKIVGTNLKFFRYKTGLSQEEFYTNLGLSVKYLSCVERGEVNVTINFLEKIAKKLNISIIDLISFDERKIIIEKRVDSKKMKC